MGKIENTKLKARSSQKLAKAAAKAIKKQQPKTTRDKIYGLSHHENGIDPITNTSYPNQRKRGVKK